MYASYQRPEDRGAGGACPNLSLKAGGPGAPGTKDR